MGRNPAIIIIIIIIITIIININININQKKIKKALIDRALRDPP